MYVQQTIYDQIQLSRMNDASLSFYQEVPWSIWISAAVWVWRFSYGTALQFWTSAEVLDQFCSFGPVLQFWTSAAISYWRCSNVQRQHLTLKKLHCHCIFLQFPHISTLIKQCCVIFWSWLKFYDQKLVNDVDLMLHVLLGPCFPPQVLNNLLQFCFSSCHLKDHNDSLVRLTNLPVSASYWSS